MKWFDWVLWMAAGLIVLSTVSVEAQGHGNFALLVNALALLAGMGVFFLLARRAPVRRLRGRPGR